MPGLRMLSLLLALLAVGAGAAQPGPDIPLVPDAAEPQPGPGMLSFEQVDRTRIDADSGALRLARTRPPREQYLAAIRFRLLRSDGTTSEKLTRFRPTQHGLLYFTDLKLDNSPGGLSESGLSLFGLANVLYRVQFGAPLQEGLGSDTQIRPRDIRLAGGQLFSPTSAFAYVEASDEEEIRVACKPGEERTAHSVHPALRGSAFEFDCIAIVKDDPDPVRYTILYLDRYGQYIPLKNIIPEDDFHVTFQVTGVAIADWK